MGGMGGTMWLGMLVYGLVVIALIGLLFAGAVRLVRGRASASLSPVKELDRRCARGELDRDEYLQRRTDLAW